MCYLPGWRTGKAGWKVASLYRTLPANIYMTTQLWKYVFHLKRASKKVCRIFGDVKIQALSAQSKTHPNPRASSTTQISHLSRAAFAGTCRLIDRKSIGSIDLRTQNMFNNEKTCSKIFKRITGVRTVEFVEWLNERKSLTTWVTSYDLPPSHPNALAVEAFALRIWAWKFYRPIRIAFLGFGILADFQSFHQSQNNTLASENMFGDLLKLQIATNLPFSPHKSHPRPSCSYQSSTLGHTAYWRRLVQTCIALAMQAA